MRISCRYLLTAALAFFSTAVFATTTCNIVNGVYVCTDGSGGSSGSTCITNNTTGQVSCVDSGGNPVGSGTSSGGSIGSGLGSILNQPSPAPGSGWLSKLTWWFSYSINVVFHALVGFLKDMVTYVCAAILALVSMAVNAIGVPSWISQYSLGSTLGQTGSVVLFFMGELQIPLALSLLGGGYVFRLTRKLLTLFQW